MLCQLPALIHRKRDVSRKGNSLGTLAFRDTLPLLGGGEDRMVSASPALHPYRIKFQKTLDKLYSFSYNIDCLIVNTREVSASEILQGGATKCSELISLKSVREKKNCRRQKGSQETPR